MYSNILLAVDFDRTLTGPDGNIPAKNLEAIAYFMENGGSFTVDTGRSTATMWKYFDVIPANVPLLLYNGSAAWDRGTLTQLFPIDLDVWQTMGKMARLFPDMNLEIQGASTHYLINAKPDIITLYDALEWKYEKAQWGQDVGVFLKFALFGKVRNPAVSDMYDASREELRRFDEAETLIRTLYGDKVDVFRAAPRIIDVHAKGVSKLNAARTLQKSLAKKLLVCVGDGENDVPMLSGADYSFCPSDAIVADRYPTVCSCGEGAVAEVIYKKIPEILTFQP